MCIYLEMMFFVLRSQHTLDLNDLEDQKHHFLLVFLAVFGEKLRMLLWLVTREEMSATYLFRRHVHQYIHISFGYQN